MWAMLIEQSNSLLVRCNSHALLALAGARIVLGVLPARWQVAVVPATTVALDLFQPASIADHECVFRLAHAAGDQVNSRRP